MYIQTLYLHGKVYICLIIMCHSTSAFAGLCWFKFWMLRQSVVIVRLSMTRRQWWKEFRYSWKSTPRVTGLTPTSGTTNTRLTIYGRLYGTYDHLQTVMVGNRPCDLRKPDSTQFYDFVWHRVGCLVEERRSGIYNITAIVPQYGYSWNASDGLRISASGQLHNFQMFAGTFYWFCVTTICCTGNVPVCYFEQ